MLGVLTVLGALSAASNTDNLIGSQTNASDVPIETV